MGMFIGTFKRQLQINGYIKNNLVEPLSIQERHDVLVEEILRRGFNHNSPMSFDPNILNYLPKEKREVKVNVVNALDDLIRRCPVCRARYQVLIDTDWIPMLDSDVDHITDGIVYNRQEHWESQKS